MKSLFKLLKTQNLMKRNFAEGVAQPRQREQRRPARNLTKTHVGEQRLIIGGRKRRNEPISSIRHRRRYFLCHRTTSAPMSFSSLFVEALLLWKSAEKASKKTIDETCSMRGGRKNENEARAPFFLFSSIRYEKGLRLFLPFILHAATTCAPCIYL